MTILFYDLVGHDTQRPFSPHCWKTKMALAHKGLDATKIPTRFLEVPKVEGGVSKTVPVIRDGDSVVADSFAIALYLDQGASDAQQEALVNVYSGKLGGPVAELAKLVGEVVSVERVPITFDVNEGRGTLTVGDVSHAELEPYRGADGSITTLSNTIFSTVPGAPVFVGKATRYRSHHEGLGHNLDLSGHNALQSTFVFDG